MKRSMEKNLFDYTLNEIYGLCVEMNTHCHLCPIEEDCISLFNIAPIRWGKRLEHLEEIKDKVFDDNEDWPQVWRE